MTRALNPLLVRQLRKRVAAGESARQIAQERGLRSRTVQNAVVEEGSWQGVGGPLRPRVRNARLDHAAVRRILESDESSGAAARRERCASSTARHIRLGLIWQDVWEEVWREGRLGAWAR